MSVEDVFRPVRGYTWTWQWWRYRPHFGVVRKDFRFCRAVGWHLGPFSVLRLVATPDPTDRPSPARETGETND